MEHKKTISSFMATSSSTHLLGRTCKRSSNIWAIRNRWWNTSLDWFCATYLRNVWFFARMWIYTIKYVNNRQSWSLEVCSSLGHITQDMNLSTITICITSLATLDKVIAQVAFFSGMTFQVQWWRLVLSRPSGTCINKIKSTFRNSLGGNKI